MIGKKGGMGKLVSKAFDNKKLIVYHCSSHRFFKYLPKIQNIFSLNIFSIRYELAYTNVLKLYTIFIDTEKNFNVAHTFYHSSHKRYNPVDN